MNEPRARVRRDQTGEFCRPPGDRSTPLSILKTVPTQDTPATGTHGAWGNQAGVGELTK